MRLIEAITAYERQRERVEGWTAYISALQNRGRRAAVRQAMLSRVGFRKAHGFGARLFYGQPDFDWP